MDYEKKYKDVLEAIKELQEANPNDEGIQNWVNDNFPELAESEDERIRNSIIENLKGNMYRADGDYDLLNKQIAWLEKQGEQKPQGKSALEAIKEKPVDNANKVASAWNNGYSNGYIQAIDKACEWLENHNDYIDVKDGNITYFDMKKCVVDFKRYLKGGEE